MAMFPCITGIPTKLNSDMQAVLNKKMGTSGQTYPSSEWAEDVNLMGMLPIKTASGAVSSFDDGADDVPIESANFGIVASGGSGGTPSSPVPIIGKSSVTVYQTGKNLVDNSASAWENGTINYQGNNASGSGQRTKGYFDVKGGGTFTLSGVIAPSDNSDFRVFFYDKNKDFISYQGYRAEFTIPENAQYFRIRNISIADISQMQIEYGSSSSTYEAYKSKTPIIIQLGQTIYGGSLSEDGTLTITYGIVDLSQVTSWTWNSTRQYFSSDVIKNVVKVPSSLSSLFKGLCEEYKIVSYNTLYNQTYANSIAINSASALGRLYVHTDGENYPPTGKLAYELATPIVVTGIDEISLLTYLGYNNIWCDSGDSEIQFRADIDLIMSAIQNSRGLMMASRSVSPMIGEEASLDRENILEEVSENLDSREEVTENSDNEESEEER